MTFAISEFASRPVETGSAIKIAFVILGATVALAGAKAFLSRSAAPVAEPVVFAVAEHAQDRCRFVPVESEAGLAKGQAIRIVCRKAR
ncbi:hypothetical protein [Methylosinus sp. LW4]|uniref:hypothetical protein n=1 Tax=Methylosinus sp. LW4 TaxID=136993 RepID=UPI0003A6D031|nr:hypothetical protein [Methylosinus sp. LW4]